MICKRILYYQRSRDIHAPQLYIHESTDESDLVKDIEIVKSWSCWRSKPMVELLHEMRQANSLENFAGRMLRDEEFVMKWLETDDINITMRLDFIHHKYIEKLKALEMN